MRPQSDSCTPADMPLELRRAKFRLSQVSGFNRGPSAFRYDPGGILRFDSLYHVYYTRFARVGDWFDLFKIPNI